MAPWKRHFARTWRIRNVCCTVGGLFDFAAPLLTLHHCLCLLVVLFLPIFYLENSPSDVKRLACLFCAKTVFAGRTIVKPRLASLDSILRDARSLASSKRIRSLYS